MQQEDRKDRKGTESYGWEQVKDRPDITFSSNSTMQITAMQAKVLPWSIDHLLVGDWLCVGAILHPPQTSFNGSVSRARLGNSSLCCPLQLLEQHVRKTSFGLFSGSLNSDLWSEKQKYLLEYHPEQSSSFQLYEFKTLLNQKLYSKNHLFWELKCT